MFHSPSTNIGVRTPAPAPVAKCIDCEHFKVFSACGRQYCGTGNYRYFPDKGMDCRYFVKGENQATRGEV